MSNVCYLSSASLAAVEDLLLPEPHHLWLYMEAQEVKCIAGKYERGQIRATWANLQIGRIVWYARHRPLPPATCAEKCKPERVAGTCRDELKKLDDLKRALDRLDRPPRPPRLDPPVLQSPPRSVRRCPTPEAMRKIRGRRVHLQQDIQPDSRSSVAAAVHLPTNGRGRF